MKDEYLTLFEAARDLVTYIDKSMFLTKPVTWDAAVSILINRTLFMI